jgi:hypothetical protein
MIKNNKSARKPSSHRANIPNPCATGHFLPDPRLGGLLSVFGGNLYQWIHAPNSYRSGQAGKPDYSTQKAHPIEPRALADRYFDPAQLVGLRFGTSTQWAGFDIDAGSLLNPLAPPPKLTSRAAAANLTRLKDAAERHGLVSPTFRRSSHQGGLWLMWQFPAALRSIEIATLLRVIAEDAGFTLQGGQLEAFPNVKPFQNTANPRNFTQFKAYRLPMQPETGDMVLDDDLEPVSDRLEVLLDHLTFTASRIDLNAVQRACALAYADHVQRLATRWKSKKTALADWIAELERITAQGFTAHHQTNDLLGKIACLGIIRDGRKRDELASFIEETAVAMPGYAQWCRHQHEIGPRSRDWASSAEAFYWHAGDPDKIRAGSHREMHERAGHGTEVSKAAAYHQRRGETALEQLRSALEALQGCALPTLTAVFQAACEKARALFGKAFSKRTWGKYRDQLASLITTLIQPDADAPAPEVALAADMPEEAPPPLPSLTPPESPEPQAQSQGTPCLQDSPENPPSQVAETQAQSKGTPCAPIMKVFEYASLGLFKPEVMALQHQTTLLRFTGSGAHGLVDVHKLSHPSPAPRNRFKSSNTQTFKASNLQKPQIVYKLQSILSGALVELLGDWHISWLADSLHEVLVYVRPCGSDWLSGIAVPLKSLHPLSDP